MRQQKLLNKTRNIYLLYALIASLIAFPVFYYFTNHLYQESIDEYLYQKKESFNIKIVPQLKIQDIENWNASHLDVQIISNQRQIIKDTIFNQIIFNKLEQEYEPFRILYSPIKVENQTFLYTDKINRLESEDLIENISALFIGLMVILFSGMILITNYISKKTWLPFYSLLNEMEKFELDKNNVPDFKSTNIEEFNRLNTSIEKLIRKNIMVYENQKEFIENAAHELQTPIAVIKAKLDNFIQDTELTEQQADWLEDIYYTISRLNRLNKNLLLLSKADKMPNLQKDKISLNTIVEKQIKIFDEQLKNNNIEVLSALQNEIVLNANKDLLETMMANLFSNAVKHNHSNGKIKVVIKSNNLIISNTGVQSEIPSDKIFKRFSKINYSNDGTGLGLAIVKKIADIYNWQVRYLYENNFHVFNVIFD